MATQNTTQSPPQTSPQDINNALAQLLAQYNAKGGIGNGVTNVAQGSSPEMTADYFANNPAAQGAFGGQPQGNQGVFSGGGNPATRQTGSWNPVTGLHDSHIDILQKVVDKAKTAQAQQFVQQVGPDKSQQLIDTHQATSGNQSQGTSQTQGGFQPGQVSPQQQQLMQQLIQRAANIPGMKPNFWGKLFPGSYQDVLGKMGENVNQAETGVLGSPEQQNALAQTRGEIVKPSIDVSQQEFSGLHDQLQSQLEDLKAYQGNLPFVNKADIPKYNAGIRDRLTTINKTSSAIGDALDKLGKINVSNIAPKGNVNSKAQQLSAMLQPGESKSMNGINIKRIK